MSKTPYRLAIAGSTDRTVLCAQAIHNDARFQLVGLLTRVAKPQGRKQILTPSPLQTWGEENAIPFLTIKKNIGGELRGQIKVWGKIDILLVVDFGYFIPDWLLQYPQIAALNIHPSQLPRWRGSSPGQFAILFGDQKSAVTLMKMNNRLDQGPIVKQIPFTIQKKWRSQDYYQFAFQLIAARLGDLIADFIRQPQKINQQPQNSPTLLARQLKKTDGFLEWPIIHAALNGRAAEATAAGSKLLQIACQHHQSWAKTIEHANRAFFPWPKLWTKIPTKKGERPMQIISAKFENNQLMLEKVKIAGQQTAYFNQIKNILVK